MNTGDGSDQTEPETVSRCVATVFEPVKALENALVFVSGNSGPIIGDRDDRAAFNDFIRKADIFDGVVDFDAVMRSSTNALALNPAYDTGDHLHPNDAGYQAMANAVDLGLFTP